MGEAKTLPSLRDELSEALGTVAEVMTSDVVAVAPEVSAAEAVMLFERAGVAGGPVVEGEQVVGVVTVRDLVQRGGRAQATGPFLRPPRGQPEWTVRDVMTRGVVAARPFWPVIEAALVMDEVRVNRLPVVDEAGRAVGILARDDVLRALARAIRGGEAEARVDVRSLLSPD
jgi:CBS domain-containing protein